MGLLTNEDTDQVIALRARHLVGRSSRCDLQLSVPVVSGEHATLWWADACWHVRDLGSRNGTLVDGKLLPPGNTHKLKEGSTLSFGDPAARWVLRSSAPPIAQAVAQDTLEVVLATQELLGLPDADSPQVTVYRAPSGDWIMEHDDTELPVSDKQTVLLGERPWLLHLPEPIGGTIDLDASAKSLSTITLRLAHSLDEEHVEVEVYHNGAVQHLRERAHHYLLLTLARQRLLDAEDPALPVTAHGWLYIDQVLRMLAIDKNQLNVHIFRARKQFAAAGVEGAANIIERRGSTQQLRIGLAALQIRPL